METYREVPGLLKSVVSRNIAVVDVVPGHEGPAPIPPTEGKLPVHNAVETPRELFVAAIFPEPDAILVEGMAEYLVAAAVL